MSILASKVRKYPKENDRKALNHEAHEQQDRTQVQLMLDHLFFSQSRC